MNDFPATKGQCLDMGGHCYQDSSSFGTQVATVYRRTCKHCGKVEIGTQQEPMRWEDE